MSARQVGLLGVPFNSSGTTDGVARAPAVLRAEGLVAALRAAGRVVDDRGDLALGPPSPERDRRSGIIAPDALAAMIAAVREAVEATLRGGAFPVVLGGDCPILLGCLGAPSLREPGLLFVDGHEDAWPPKASPTGEAADMELGLALGRHHDDLPVTLDGEVPRLDPRRIVVVGARDIAEIAEAGVESIDRLVEVIRPDAISGAHAAELGAETARRLGAQGPCWCHVDLDVLGTDALGSVDYRQPGGFDWATLTALVRGALGQRSVAGLTVTIYNPDLDPDRSDARRIIKFITDVLAA